MNVGFYGHVRQYHNLKSEIDRNIHAVLGIRPVCHGSHVAAGLANRLTKIVCASTQTRAT